MTKNINAQKVTVTIPYELKNKLNELKDDMKVSISSIYKEALENYIEQKEIQKWQKGVHLASKDKEYQKTIIEDHGDDVYEY